MTLARALYRVRQFSNAAKRSLNSTERRQVDEALTETEQQLFYSMTAFGQRHCLNVYRTLLSEHVSDGDVLKAALLHDAGKEGVGISHRVSTVLLQAFAPGLLKRLISNRKGSWRYGLYRSLNHAEYGADLAKRAGAPEAAVELIRLHQSRETADKRLLMLQQADEMN